MLTVVTGVPGTGKTAHTIDMVWFQQDSIWHDLEKYVDGIADLKLEHFEFPDIKTLKSPQYVPLSQVDSEDYACWLPENPYYSAFVEARATAKTAWDLWFLWATPKSVLLIDEAQRYMRPRPAGSPVPLAIQMIEYHRHFGIHIILITQKERLLHSNVRMLAGQHIHLNDGWRGRHRFEWPECKDTDSKSEKSNSAHASYKLPVHVFSSYKSTVEVLKTAHKKPFFMYMMYGAVLMIPLMIYGAYKSYQIFTHAHDKPAASSSSGSIVQASGVSPVGVQLPVLSGSSGVPSLEAQTNNFLADFKPLVPGRPETAPAFSKLRDIVVMPVVAACVQSTKHCFCYTQQGTKVADMSESSCVDYLEQGAHFNPYQRPAQVASASFTDAVRRVPSAQPVEVSEKVYGVPDAFTALHADRSRTLQ